ncbi:unnamed protein product [Pleuronectes platessa]|uniref:Uncharacterized protein n=1 Tax=Pleuronectes platessa TaxID=8262 RepID=A0A9N7URG2_PLEPL|nr:unnamed protein product [Pleuronectes platessa]
MELMELMELMEQMEQMELMELMELMEQMEQMELMVLMEQMELMELMELMEQTSSPPPQSAVCRVEVYLHHTVFTSAQVLRPVPDGVSVLRFSWEITGCSLQASEQLKELGVQVVEQEDEDASTQKLLLKDAVKDKSACRGRASLSLHDTQLLLSAVCVHPEDPWTHNPGSVSGEQRKMADLNSTTLSRPIRKKRIRGRAQDEASPSSTLIGRWEDDLRPQITFNTSTALLLSTGNVGVASEGAVMGVSSTSEEAEGPRSRGGEGPRSRGAEEPRSEEPRSRGGEGPRRPRSRGARGRGGRGAEEPRSEEPRRRGPRGRGGRGAEEPRSRGAEEARSCSRSLV